MNKVELIGRLTKDAEVRYSGQGNAIANFNIAVDRKFKKEGEQNTDFINCVAFGKLAEFFERFGRKGTKFAVVGSIQTGSYKNNDGKTVYTTNVVVEEAEFTESKNSSQGQAAAAPVQKNDGFVNIPDSIDDDELPFN